MFREQSNREQLILEVESVTAARKVIATFHYLRTEFFNQEGYGSASMYNAPVYVLTPEESALWEKHFSLRKTLQSLLNARKIYKLVNQEEVRRPVNPKLEQYLTDMFGHLTPIGSDIEKSKKSMIQEKSERRTIDIINFLHREKYQGDKIPQLASQEDLDQVTWVFYPTAFHTTGSPSHRGAAMYLYTIPMLPNDEPLLHLWDEQLARPEQGVVHTRRFTDAKVIQNEIGFNSLIEKGRLNEIILDRYNGCRTDLTIASKCEIHDPSAIQSLQIPNDPKLRLVFYALSRMIYDFESPKIAH